MYEISEVVSKKDLREFVKFPDRLYKDCPQYVPALHSDQIRSLTKVSTLSYCKRRMWLVRKDGKVAGRICGMINPRYNERYGTKRARFGWFDTIEDLEVAKLLIGTAEEWALSEGMEDIHGPLYYNTLGKQGMLVEGFENTPPFNCLYNYPYYNDFVAALGYEKECDWLQYVMVANHGVPDKTRRVAKLIMERYNLHFGSIDKLKKDPEQVRNFFRIYNESFSATVHNFIPFTDEEIEEEAESIMPYVSDRLCDIVLDENDNLVAFGINLPSISKALQKARGHLFPFGWFHLMRAMHNYETIDMMINGATPKWQNTGVSAVYYKDISDRFLEYGSRRAISNPQMESNSAVNIWNCYEHELFMRRRCYIKRLKKLF